MSGETRLNKINGDGQIAKGRAMPAKSDELRLREGYAMPEQPPSRGPVSARPGSALPPKSKK